MRRLAVLVLVLAACGDTATTTTTTTASGAAPPTATTVPAATTTTGPRTSIGPPPTSPPAPAADLRFVDLGSHPPVTVLTVTVEPGDVSMLVWARAPGPGDEVAIARITDPSGEVIYDLDLDSFEVFGGVLNAPLVDLHEVAVTLPIDGDTPLAPGDYTFAIDALADEITASGAILRSGDVAGPQALDVRIVVATTNDDLADSDRRETFAAEVRATGEALLNPHGIEVGALSFLDAPADFVDRFAELEADESDEQQRELCRELGERLPPTRAVDLVVVDRVVDPSDDGGVIEGNAAGLPGVVLTPGALTSCVVVVTERDVDRSLLDRAIVVWHEAGHLLGLPHTSEADGSAFDYFADTPECPIDRDEDGDGFVDEFECPDGGNFMFHDTDSLIMSEDQAWFLRRRPLLYPVG